MTWDSVRREIEGTHHRQGEEGPHDRIRRKKIIAAESISNTPLIVYATDFTDAERAVQHGAGTLIDLGDKTGFLQAISDIPCEKKSLDLLIHSPGGSPTAAESIVQLLRDRFEYIRFIVPHTAKSAATMMALSGNEILLGEAAELGPIDPQLQIVNDQRSPLTVPAGAAIDQFQRIHDEVIQDPRTMRKWIPIIRQYGPSFLQECHNAVSLSEELVKKWLMAYMLHGEPNAKDRAKNIATTLSTHGNFKSHSRPLHIKTLQSLGIKARPLRDISEKFEQAIMDVYWAIDVTLSGTGAFKIIEHSSRNAAYMRLSGSFKVEKVKQAAPAAPLQNRHQRRAQASHK